VAAGGSKEDLPKNLSQTPQHVVEVALAEMDLRRKPTVLTGVKNKIFAGMSRLLPRKTIVKMTGTMMPQH
jgi:short-subunit dehydrogenase